MKKLKERLQSHNLSQYMAVTSKEMSGLAGNHQDSNNSILSEEEEKPPQKIMTSKNKKGGKKQDKVEMEQPDNHFEDNYAFYMYYLNSTGQLVTPLDQMFEGNAAKQEQLRKFKDTQEKHSRVVKPQIQEERSPPKVVKKVLKPVPLKVQGEEQPSKLLGKAGIKPNLNDSRSRLMTN